MFISIEPAKIVGAEIGDRVSWSTGRYPGATRTYGRIVGISTVYENHIEVAPEGREDDRRHIEPDCLAPAPRKYAVGDEIGEADLPHLPNGTLLLDEGFLPTYKFKDDWYVIDVTDPMVQQGVRPIDMIVPRARTIARLPRTYILGR